MRSSAKASCSDPPSRRRPTRRALPADGLLLLAAAIWGFAFVAQRTAMKHVGPITFTGVRFALGAAVLLPLIWLGRRGTGRVTQRGAWRAGCLAGTVLFAGAVLQQIGMVGTPAGKAAFITGLYVVLVPVLGCVGGRPAGWNTWAGAVIAAGGLYLLSVSGALGVQFSDLLVLACAVLWAIHLLILAELAPRQDPLRLAAIQFGVVAALAVPGAALLAAFAAGGVEWAWHESFAWRELWGARVEILYAGLLSVGIGYTLQVVGQRTAPPAHAGILLSLEAVFGAVGGWLLLGEELTIRQWAGCGLMLAGMCVSQWRPGGAASGG